MKLFRKICQRLTDPVFYRKRTRDLLRGFRRFEDGAEAHPRARFPGLEEAVIVIAHPDDEVFCSGLICGIKEQGARVRVLCLTKGEGGPRGEHPRESLGRIRAEEMRRSCEVLGVDELVFLGHIDPEGKGFKVFAPEVSPADLATQILPHLEGASLAVSHGSSGEYWHPGHLLVYEAVKEAVERCGEAAPTWLTFSARQAGHRLGELVNWDDPADLLLDGTRFERTRLRALDCHRTQLGLFSKFASGDHADFIRYTAREGYCLQRRGRLEIPEAADVGERQRDHRAER
ncbi:MAG: PIG-L family deacetylase [Verrucomicrobiae bacterium]|nr:PIG-L family deacetylase [Verrucomicrobiae bacterium]